MPVSKYLGNIVRKPRNSLIGKRGQASGDGDVQEVRHSKALETRCQDITVATSLEHLEPQSFTSILHPTPPPRDLIHHLPSISETHPSTAIMDIDKKPVPEYLEAERDSNTPAELQHFFLDFQEFWERRLWHQLTNSLDEFFKNPASVPQRLSLFQNFVMQFSDKINQLKLVEFGLAASQQCKGMASPPKHLWVISGPRALLPITEKLTHILSDRCQWQARLPKSP